MVWSQPILVGFHFFFYVLMLADVGRSAYGTLQVLYALRTTVSNSLHTVCFIARHGRTRSFWTVHSRLTDEREAARNDALTGLRNRHGFFEAASGPLALCTRHGRPVALVFIDLDHFKRANDTLGHAAGDDLLREGGRIVQASIRGSDIAARLGGDEFVVLLPETSAGDAAELGRRIGSALEAAPGFRQAGVSASVGVVADPTALCSLSDLLKQADAQMYQAKRAGRRSTAGPLDAATRDEADLLEPPAALTTPG